MIERHCTLMIPGPSEAATETQLAMAQPTIPHYGDDWTAMNHRVLEKLQRIFQTKNDMYIIPGSSSAAMEAAVNSVIERDTEVLVNSRVSLAIGSGKWWTAAAGRSFRWRSPTEKP